MGPTLILPGVNVPSFANYQSDISGIDSPDKVGNLDRWHSYPHRVIYHYNSRGFRDKEWIWDYEQLRQCVWCVGDSFTAGIGQPLQHTWPWVFGQQCEVPVHNVSMDGASNQWIARMCETIHRELAPRCIIVMWSYIHRREHLDPALQASVYGVNRETMQQQWQDYYDAVKDDQWPPCPSLEDFALLPATVRKYIQKMNPLPWLEISQDLHAHICDDARARIHYVRETEQQDLDNFRLCVEKISDLSSKILHATIPRWCPAHLISRGREILESRALAIPYFEHLDWARDQVHFDIKTSQWIADHLKDLFDQCEVRPKSFDHG